MTPADELRAAAKLLREAADDLGDWRYDERMGFVRDRNGDLVCEASESEGAWIALMGPDKAPSLASWLDVTADSMPQGFVHSAEQEAALSFARSILATQGDKA